MITQNIERKDQYFLFKTRHNNRVATCQGKVREKLNFLQVRELSGNFEKMSGNFVHLTNVRELSGNFVMTINFFPKIISILLLVYFFQVLKFLLALFLSAYIPIIPFSKMLHYVYDFILIDFIANTVYRHTSIFR